VHQAETLIQTRGLTRWFGGLCAVDDVGFEIRRGEVVGFLGPNGAGKSTTMRMLTGGLCPDAGQVRIAGSDPFGPAREALAARSALGYLPETTPLHGGMRVDSYLSFVAGLRGLSGARRRSALERVVESCDLCGMTSRRVETLSKGFRQRVGLAQALVADPDVLVLDEPTSGLDPAEIVRIRDLVLRLARTKTILVSTHVLPEVEEVCRRVLIVAAGRLVADGELGELLEEQAEGLRVQVRAEGGAGEATALAECLAQVPGVHAVEEVAQVEGTPPRLRAELAVEQRFSAAEGVSMALAKAGFTTLELTPRGATLETLFLRRTRGLERRRAASSSASAGGDA